MPFLPESTVLGITQTRTESLVPKCGICRLYKGCKSPKMKVFGNGRRKILIVGEAPGEREDLRGRPFIGQSGKFLDYSMTAVGISLVNDCWLTNAIICRPPKNRTPTQNEIEYCRPNLTNTIKELQPNVIVPLGHAALESVLMGIWREDLGPISRWVGWKIPCRDLNCWITPAWHPSYILRELDVAKGGTAIEVIFRRHIRQARRISSKPYHVVPKIEKQVEVVLNSNEAAKILTEFTSRGGLIAFDYETNMLKPDHKDSDIVAASVCWRGQRTIAFPFQGEKLLAAYKKLMQSDCPKIGHNLKFEDRWTNAVLGYPIRNWVWDSMIQAHLTDPRRGICSLAFQGFIQCGVGTYYSHISPLLEQKGSYAKNKIREIDLQQLLLYNGIDSLLTYLVAQKQAKIPGVKIA